MLNLESIKARLAAATPGPWKRDRSWWITGPLHIWRSELGDREFSDQLICQICGPGSLNNDKADQDFIINAAPDMAALIEEVEQLRETVARYQADVANSYKLMALYQEQRDVWMQEAQRGFEFEGE